MPSQQVDHTDRVFVALTRAGIAAWSCRPDGSFLRINDALQKLLDRPEKDAPTTLGELASRFLGPNAVPLEATDVSLCVDETAGVCPDKVVHATVTPKGATSAITVDIRILVDGPTPSTLDEAQGNSNGVDVIGHHTGVVRWTDAHSSGPPSEREGSLSDALAYFSATTADYVYALQLDSQASAAVVIAGSPERITGRPQEEITSARQWASFIHPADQQSALSGFSRAMTGSPVVLEYRFLTGTGSIRWFRESIRPRRGSNGKITTVIGGVTDVTDERRAEEQLLQAQRMEGVALMAGSIAHDFANYLTVIQGALFALESSVATVSTTASESFDDIRRATNSITELTRSLLALGQKSRVDATSDVASVARNMVRLLIRAVRADIALAVEVPMEPVVAHISESAFEGILLNLVVNARDAITGAGRVDVEVKPNSAPPPELLGGVTATDVSFVCVSVRDDGAGMDDETRAHAFDPFFTTKDRTIGSGLGLSSVFATVKQAGGVIVVDSTRDQGTTFRFWLPMVASSPAQNPTSASPAVVGVGGLERLLVVDDDPGVLRLMSRALRSLGYDVTEATNGTDAHRLVVEQDTPFDLLICDVRMPVMSGPDLAKILAKDRPTLPVLFVSGYIGDADDDGMLSKLNARFLAKPFTPKALATAVRAFLDGATVSPANATARKP